METSKDSRRDQGWRRSVEGTDARALATSGAHGQGPIRRPLQRTDKRCKGIVRGMWSEWEGACADWLCRGGHFRPPLMPEMAISAQMQIVMAYIILIKFFKNAG